MGYCVIGVGVLWSVIFSASLILGQLQIASLAVIVLFFLSLILILPGNKFVRTLNWLLQLLLCICLIITLVSTAIVIYIDEAYLGLINIVCEDDFTAGEDISPAFKSVEACVDYI